MRKVISEERPSFLDDESLGWVESAEAIKKGDEVKIKGYKEDIDTLLVFVRESCSVYHLRY